jgi:hypothetical protein
LGYSVPTVIKTNIAVKDKRQCKGLSGRFTREYENGGIPIDVKVIIGDSPGVFAFCDQNYIRKKIYGLSAANNAGKFTGRWFGKFSGARG